jgi:tryptophan synthase alpha chain
MNRINELFKKRKALIGYITVGYPDVETTLHAVRVMAANGVDAIELGVPFSDPLADGVTIQNASFQALQAGVTTDVCLDVAAKLSQKVSVPLVFMGYYNPVLNFGLKKFCRECATSGVSALIIPDLPPDEAQELDNAAAENSVDLIYLLAPTSTDERIRLVASRSRSFIYLASLVGVTGVRTGLSSGLRSFLSRVREIAGQPLAVGFGISTPEQAKEVSKLADGVIIGSRILQLIESDRSLVALGNFIKELRAAIG